MLAYCIWLVGRDLCASGATLGMRNGISIHKRSAPVARELGRKFVGHGDCVKNRSVCLQLVVVDVFRFVLCSRLSDSQDMG